MPEPANQSPKRRALIIGVTSAIAGATARLLAADGARLFVTGRDGDRLEATVSDLEVRGARGERNARGLHVQRLGQGPYAVLAAGLQHRRR